MTNQLNFKNSVRIILFNGYRLDKHSYFCGLSSPGLQMRAGHSKYALWDPNDDDDGFLISGDYPSALVNEFFTYFGEYLENA